MHYDIIVVQDTADTMTDYRQVAADVLLLGGTKSPQFLKTSLDALELELLNVRRMTLEGLDHLSAANDGKPEVVAGGAGTFLRPAVRGGTSSCDPARTCQLIVGPAVQ